MNRTFASIILTTVVACSSEPLSQIPTTDRCVLDTGRLTGNLTIDASCRSIRVVDDLLVEDGLVLRIPPGTHLVFDPGVSLIVGERSTGQLIALGLPGQPIRFSGAADPRGVGGGWGGILLGGGTLGSSALGQVIVEGGGDPDDPTRGCVSILGVLEGALAIGDIELADCAGPGLVVDAGPIRGVGKISVRSTEVGVRLAPRNVVDFVDAIELAEVARNILIGGAIERNTTLRPLGARWDVEGDLAVRGALAPTLILAAGTNLSFETGRWLAVGTDAAGSIETRGGSDDPVVLTAQDDTAGGWHGLILGAETLTAALSGLRIEHGGGEGLNVRGCLSIDARDYADIRLTGVAIDDCLIAAVGASENADFSFSRFEATSISNAPVGVALPAHGVATIGPSVSFENTPFNVVLGGAIEQDATWAGRDLPWRVTSDILIRGPSGPVLTIEDGVTLEFGEDRRIEVGNASPGGLVVRGSPDRPVKLVAASAGGWRGIVLGPLTKEGTTIEHVRLERGGAVGPNVGGCLSIQSPEAGLVTVVDTVFAACEQTAVHAPTDGFGFRAFARNQIESSATAMIVAPSAVGTIASDNTFADAIENVMLGGVVQDDGRWATQTVPWRVTGNVVIDGSRRPNVSMDPGLTLAFEDGAALLVGTTDGGAITAVGETNATINFTSANDSAVPGAWRGLFFGPGTQRTILENVRIVFAGLKAPAGLTLDKTGTNVRITTSSFGSNAPADVFVDCDSAPVLEMNSYGSPGGLVRATNCP